MKALISRRLEKAFTEGQLKPSFTVPCRTAVDRVLDEHSVFDEWNENVTYVAAEEQLKTFYGRRELVAFGEGNKRRPTRFSGLLTGGYPSEFLDAIEAWFSQQPERTRECERELNDVFAIHHSDWRILNGEAVLLNSEFLHNEVRAKAVNLLGQVDALGGLEEFQEAVSDLTSGRPKDAVTKAHKAVESTMKTVLGTKERLTFGGLLDRLVKSGVVPEYYEGFLRNFEQLAIGAVKERNLSGAHGQGSEATELAPALAELAVNLAGSMIVFLAQSGAGTVAGPITAGEEEWEGEDIPF